MMCQRSRWFVNRVDFTRLPSLLCTRRRWHQREGNPRRRSLAFLQDLWNIYTDEAEAEASDVVFPATMCPVRTEDNLRRNFDPRITERYGPEATSWSNFTSVFDDRTSFRAKGLRGTTWTRTFTSVFDDRTSFRAKGLRGTTWTRTFTSVFDDRGLPSGNHRKNWWERSTMF